MGAIVKALANNTTIEVLDVSSLPFNTCMDEMCIVFIYAQCGDLDMDVDVILVLACLYRSVFTVRMVWHVDVVSYGV